MTDRMQDDGSMPGPYDREVIAPNGVVVLLGSAHEVLIADRFNAAPDALADVRDEATEVTA